MSASLKPTPISDQILDLRAQGVPRKDIAAQFGISLFAYDQIVLQANSAGIIEHAPPRSPTSERNRQMWEMRNKGVTFADIGRRFGISGELVRIIYTQMEERGRREQRDMCTRKCLRCQKTVPIERPMFTCTPCRLVNDGVSPYAI
jgi:DNA-binding CsgD family transcriptional regulator